MRKSATAANLSETKYILRWGRWCRVRPLVYLVKQWVKNRKIHEPYKGYLSSYTYTLMVMHYLQVEHLLHMI